ncbi:HepT-like ribonuclease domain-containing protein [Salinibacter ruber]|nr:HepT-like ribonuclease domain-containing protein [Salinibacter ruber]
MEAAEEFVEDSRFEDVERSLEKQFALQRAFEVIGEATKQLDPSIRERYSDVLWEDMAGMRDVLIHQYFAVDL